MPPLSPEQLRHARTIAATAPGTRYDALLVATALAESNLDPTAAGDAGRSHGVFQEYDLGRGAGIPIAGRRNVRASTLRAYREFASLGSRFSGPELAYRAQRPADRASYVRRVAQLLPLARQAVAGAPGRPPAGGARPRPTRGGGGGARQLTPGSAEAVRRYAVESEADVMAGRIPAEVDTLVASLKFTGPAAAKAIRAQRDRAERVAVSAQGRTRLTMGGGPEAHGSRALGNWQSDRAYDLMGKAGQAIFSPVGGTVVKISGSPGGNPQFAGYGITVRTARGDLFFKHLGSTRLRPGASIRPGDLVGTLDARTAGGPHLHLGGESRPFLEQIARLFTGGGR